MTTGGTTYSYTYNGLGRAAPPECNGGGDRLNQTVNGVTTRYTLDLNAGLTQVLSDGTNTYLYGLARIAQRTGVDSAYYLADALGSVRQLADASGAVTLTRQYKPFGEVLRSTGSGASVFGFDGEQTDPTGNLYLRARYYDMGDGRFLSKDNWIGDFVNPLTINKWVFVTDNPIIYTDPTGNLLDPSEPTHRGTIIHWMIQAQFESRYSTGNISKGKRIANGSTKVLRKIIRQGGDPNYDPDQAEKYANGFADIIDFGERGLYEIKPYLAETLGIATVKWYISAYNSLDEGNPLHAGIRYPSEDVIVGTDPEDSGNWIKAKEKNNNGVILYWAVKKQPNVPEPVWVWEWDKQTQSIRKIDRSQQPVPAYPAVLLQNPYLQIAICMLGAGAAWSTLGSGGSGSRVYVK